MEVSDRLQKGLRYSYEDVESSFRFVLFCPFKILEDGTMIKHGGYHDPRTHLFCIVFQIQTLVEPFQIP